MTNIMIDMKSNPDQTQYECQIFNS